MEQKDACKDEKIKAEVAMQVKDEVPDGEVEPTMQVKTDFASDVKDEVCKLESAK
mgnify:CR=1 FL=1